MKLKDIHESFLAVTGPAGRNDHTHRYDPSKESGETTIDDFHYHSYRKGEKMTTETMAVPKGADFGKDHEHYLPAEMIMGQDVGEDIQLDEIAAPKEKIIFFLKQLENPDLQKLTTNEAGVNQLPKANAPLSITVEEDEYGKIKVRGLYWNTSRGTAIRTMQIKLESMLDKLDAACHYIYIRGDMMHGGIITDLPIPPEDFEELAEIHVLVHTDSTRADLRSGGSGDIATGTK